MGGIHSMLPYNCCYPGEWHCLGCKSACCPHGYCLASKSCSWETFFGMEGCTCTLCKGNLPAGAPSVCGCKTCWCINCGYMSLAPVKAATGGAAAFFLVAANEVKTDAKFQVLLAVSLFFAMLTAVLFMATFRGKTMTDSSENLNTPLVNESSDGRGEVPSSEKVQVVPVQQNLV